MCEKTARSWEPGAVSEGRLAKGEGPRAEDERKAVSERRSGRGLDAGDFEFEAAELGMIVVAQAPGQVDCRVRRELQAADAVGEIPADGGERRALCPSERARRGPHLQHAEADVALLHEKRERRGADVARDEDRLFVAHTEGLEAAQPGKQGGRDLVEGQLGVALQRITQVFFAQMFSGVGSESSSELVDSVGW